MKAIYYDRRYFLLPKPHLSLSSFVRETDFSRVLELDELLEKDCLAPYFTPESLKKSSILIQEPKYMALVDVTILERSVYNNQLKEIVKDHCNGCLRYGNDYEDLTGHFEEMSLDGVCFERDELNTWVPAYGFMYFWRVFKHLQPKIEKLILKKRFHRAESILQKYAQLPGFCQFFVRYYDNHFHFYVTPFEQPISRLFIDFFIRMGKNFLIDNWIIHPYLDKGGFKRQTSIKYDQITKNPPLVIVKPLTSEGFKQIIFVLINPYKESTKQLVQNYLALVEKVGEDRFLSIIEEFYYIDDTGFDLLSHVKRLDMHSIESSQPLTPKQLDLWIKTKETQYSELNRPYPNAFYQTAQTDNGFFHESPYFSEVRTITSRILPYDFDRLYGEGGYLERVMEHGVTVGTLILKLKGSIEEQHQDTLKIERVIEEELFNALLGEKISTYQGDNTLMVNFFIMNPWLIRKKIRDISPFLRLFEARYGEYFGNSEALYHVNYLLDKVQES